MDHKLPKQNCRNYRVFKSSQQGIHPCLKKIIINYCQSDYLKPSYDHQVKIFEKIKLFCEQFPGPIIVDSGCGTGHSTIKLAELFPCSAVIGIDKTNTRLKKAPHSKRNNYLLVTGDFFDLWHMLIKSNISVSHHFVFYPNPWPKISHIKRRIYAHPLFPAIIKKSNYFELRTNWDKYAQDLVYVLKLLEHQIYVKKISNKNYISLFEKKYLEQNCDLYQIRTRSLTRKK